MALVGFCKDLGELACFASFERNRIATNCPSEDIADVYEDKVVPFAKEYFSSLN